MTFYTWMAAVYLRAVRRFVCVASIILLCTSSAFCGPRKAEVQRADVQGDERLVFVTGSLIPQRVKVRKVGSNTTSPVDLIDRHEIDSTGRFTTPGAFANEPSARIIGR